MHDLVRVTSFAILPRRYGTVREKYSEHFETIAWALAGISTKIETVKQVKKIDIDKHLPALNVNKLSLV